MYTVYDRMYGNSPANNTVYTRLANPTYDKQCYALAANILHSQHLLLLGL